MELYACLKYKYNVSPLLKYFYNLYGLYNAALAFHLDYVTELFILAYELTIPFSFPVDNTDLGLTF